VFLGQTLAEKTVYKIGHFHDSFYKVLITIANCRPRTVSLRHRLIYSVTFSEICLEYFIHSHFYSELCVLCSPLRSKWRDAGFVENGFGRGDRGTFICRCVSKLVLYSDICDIYCTYVYLLRAYASIIVSINKKIHIYRWVYPALLSEGGPPTAIRTTIYRPTEGLRRVSAVTFTMYIPMYIATLTLTLPLHTCTRAHARTRTHTHTQCSDTRYSLRVVKMI
jgi:hypothetical protein